MKLKTTYGLTIILAILSACSGPKKDGNNDKVVIEERISIPNTKAEKLINVLRPESQKFQINADSDNIITGKNGTQVFVPKNSFINAGGELVTGKVDIEIIEVLSVADFIKTNLQTVSNGRPFQSEGMLYVDAKSNGEQVALAPDKKLQIELPNINKLRTASDIKIFSGNYDSLGNINWTESGKIENKLIPLPLDQFDYKTWTSFGFIRVPRNQGYKAPGNDEIEDSTTFKMKSLENTFIATREFEERFPHINSAEWAIGHYTSYYSTTVQTGRMVKDSTISKIYLNNLDKNLWYCDSLAYTYMKTWEGKVDFNSYWYSEVETYDLLNAFKKFYEQRLTTVITFPADIDLRKNDAREKLTAKGFTEVEIDEILGAYERHIKIVTVRRNKITAQRITTNSFSVAKLGWINCDQFYNDPKAKEVDIFASVLNPNNFDFACLTLIINNRRIALSGIEKDGKYKFTGETGLYTKLPVGEKATIVGISYKDSKPFFGLKEITISEKGSYELDLQASSTQDINKKLNEIQ